MFDMPDNMEQMGGHYDEEAVESLETELIYQITQFLASSLFVGIGPRLAKKIVLYFGIHTIEIIETSPAKLLKVRLIGQKRKEAIKHGWTAQTRMKEACKSLMSLRVQDSQPKDS